MLQVRAKVVGVPSGRCWRRLAAPRGTGRQRIGAGQTDRSRVVVHLGAVDAKGVHRVEHQSGEQAGPIRVEETLEATPDAVVVDQVDLARAGHSN